jgi:predicted nucleic acid-binding protein
MNKKALEGLVKEEEVKEEINDVKKSIRHLEIELDYIENKEPHNYKYIRSLENQIDNFYEKLDKLYETK